MNTPNYASTADMRAALDQIKDLADDIARKAERPMDWDPIYDVIDEIGKLAEAIFDLAEITDELVRQEEIRAQPPTRLT